MSNEVQGVIAIFVSPEHGVMAVGTDFGEERPGGFEKHEAQRRRANESAAANLVSAYCGWVIAPVLDAYLRSQIIEQLRNKAGGKFIYHAIGYPDDITEEIERS